MEKKQEKNQPPEGGNDSDVNLEDKQTEGKIKVEGFEDVKTFTDDEGMIKIEVPEGLEGEELEKFKRRAQQVVDTAGKTYHDRMTLKQDIKQFEEEKENKLKKIRAEEEKLKKKQLEIQTAKQQSSKKEVSVPNLKKILSGLTGRDIKTWDEVEELRIDDPDIYYQAQQRVTAESMKFLGQQNLDSARMEAEQVFLEAKIKDEGYDPLEVKIFATNYLGMPYNIKAFEQFKLNHPKKKDVEDEFNKIQDIRKQQVSFVKQGALVKKSRIRELTKAKLDKMSPKELKELDKELDKELG